MQQETILLLTFTHVYTFAKGNIFKTLSWMSVFLLNYNFYGMI